MKKVKLIVAFLIIMITLTGCTSKSEVTLNSNGKVFEKVEITGINDDISYDDDIVSNSLDSCIDKYKSVLDFRKYKIEKFVDEKKYGVIVTKEYKNICSYFQDTAFNQYVFKHISCVEDDNYYIIKNDTDYIPYCEDCSDWPILDEVSLTISFPFEPLEQNADDIDGNTYKWNFGKNAKSNSIYIKLSKSMMQEEKNKNEIKKNVFSFAKIILMVIVGLIILIITYIFIRKLYNKYKKNKLDY